MQTETITSIERQDSIFIQNGGTANTKDAIETKRKSNQQQHNQQQQQQKHHERIIKEGIKEPKKLHGCDKQIDELHQIYHQVITTHVDSLPLVLVSGDEGTGKTALVNTLYDRVKQDNGFWMVWRGEEAMDMKAGNGIEGAFSQLCQQIMDTTTTSNNNQQQTSAQQESIRQSILKMGSLQLSLLIQVFPQLETFLDGYYTPPQHLNHIDTSGKTVFAIQRFLQICSANRPLVCVFEDFHFAHPNAIAIFSRILLLPNNRTNYQNLLCLATISNNTDNNKEIHGLLQKINVTATIRMANLDRETNQTMVGDMLRLQNTNDCRPLADFLHRQTDGNPLFVSGLLRLMHETGVMTLDCQQEEQEQQHDNIYIKSWKIHDNVDSNDDNYNGDRMGAIKKCIDLATLMEQRLRLLPDTTREAIMVAAGLGTRISTTLIQDLIATPLPTDLFQTAVRMRLVKPISSGGNEIHDNNNNNNKQNTIYHFSHCCVRKGALYLLSDSERPPFHVSIGRKIWKNMIKSKDTSAVFDVLCQLKMGLSELTDPKERYEAALLCVEAAEWQLKWPGAGFFRLAMDCLEFGIVLLLPIDGWKNHYDLTMRIHNICAELAFTTSHHERAQQLTETIIQNAVHFEDKIQALCTRLLVISTTNDLQKITTESLDVFEQLGEPIPRQATHRDVKREYNQTKNIIKSMSTERILRLPKMQDVRKTATLQTFNLAHGSFFMLEPSISSVIVMRAIRLSVKHGLCATSAYMFGIYGWFVCSQGDIEEGTRMGKICLDILKRFELQQWIPRCYAAVYGRIGSYTKGLRAAYDHLTRSQCVASETGDYMGSVSCGFIRCSFLFYSGEPLPIVQSEVERNLRDCPVSVNGIFQQMLNQFPRVVMLLQTKEENPSLECAEQLVGHPLHCAMDEWKSFHMAIIAYLFDNHELALKVFERARVLDSHNILKSAEIALVYLLDGLICMSVFRSTGKGKRRAIRVARSRLKQLKRLAQHNPRFCNGKVALLEAEIASIRGDYQRAYVLYIAACSMYAGEGMLMEHAISLELCASMCMNDQRKYDVAKDLLKEAVESYRKWGAVGKAQKVEKYMKHDEED